MRVPFPVKSVVSVRIFARDFALFNARPTAFWQRNYRPTICYTSRVRHVGTRFSRLSRPFRSTGTIFPRRCCRGFVFFLRKTLVLSLFEHDLRKTRKLFFLETTQNSPCSHVYVRISWNWVPSILRTIRLVSLWERNAFDVSIA